MERGACASLKQFEEIDYCLFGSARIKEAWVHVLLVWLFLRKLWKMRDSLIHFVFESNAVRI